MVPEVISTRPVAPIFTFHRSSIISQKNMAFTDVIAVEAIVEHAIGMTFYETVGQVHAVRWCGCNVFS